MHRLGYLLAEGFGGPTDVARAVPLLEKAVRAGQTEAATHLGIIYYNGGDGIPTDFPRSLQWFRKAAEAGNGFAEGMIGLMYTRGEGVRQNYAQARRYYKEAISHANQISIYHLGLLFEFGQGVPEDRDFAVLLYQDAAARGVETAAGRLRELGITPPKPRPDAGSLTDVLEKVDSRDSGLASARDLLDSAPDNKTDDAPGRPPRLKILRISDHDVIVYYPNDSGSADELPSTAQSVVDALKPDIATVALIDLTDPLSARVVDTGTSKDLVLLLGDRKYGQRYSDFKKHIEEILKHSPHGSVYDLRLDDRITVRE
jgi:hypothetical protein